MMALAVQLAERRPRALAGNLHPPREIHLDGGFVDVERAGRRLTRTELEVPDSPDDRAAAERGCPTRERAEALGHEVGIAVADLDVVDVDAERFGGDLGERGAHPLADRGDADVDREATIRGRHDPGRLPGTDPAFLGIRGQTDRDRRPARRCECAIRRSSG